MKRRWVALATLLVLLGLALGGYVFARERTGSIYHPHARFVPEANPTLPTRGAERFTWPLYGYTKNHTRYFPAPASLHPPFKEAWARGGPSLREFPPVLSENRIFQLTDDGVLSAVDKYDGKVLWSHTLLEPPDPKAEIPAEHHDDARGEVVFRQVTSAVDLVPVHRRPNLLIDKQSQAVAGAGQLERAPGDARAGEGTRPVTPRRSKLRREPVDRDRPFAVRIEERCPVAHTSQIRVREDSCGDARRARVVRSSPIGDGRLGIAHRGQSIRGLGLRSAYFLRAGYRQRPCKLSSLGAQWPRAASPSPMKENGPQYAGSDP